MVLRVSVPRRVLIPSRTKDPGTLLCDEGSQDDLHAVPPGTILGSGPLGTLPDAALSTPFRLGYFKTLTAKPSEEALHPGPAGDPPPRPSQQPQPSSTSTHCRHYQSTPAEPRRMYSRSSVHVPSPMTCGVVWMKKRAQETRLKRGISLVAAAERSNMTASTQQQHQQHRNSNT
ncbi:hypothetical protein A4X03_0g6579, partial [Tilletia caries]